MSFPSPPLHRNHLISFAAFLLQNVRRVRALGVCLAVLAASPAFAQSTSGTGTCTGGGLSGTVGIALPPADNPQSIQAASVPFAFSGADCQCMTDDLLLDIFLTGTFPSTTTGTLEFWVGSGCDTNTTARSTAGQTICQKITTTVGFSQFVQGTTPSGGHIYIPIPATALFAPVTNVCPSGTTSNGIFVLLFSGTMSATSGAPFATCSIPSLQLSSGQATAVTNVSAAAGDSAVTLSWSIPTGSTTLNYQILCADAAGNPGKTNPPANIYSACVDGVMERRALATGGTLPGSTDDAGIGSASFTTESLPGGGVPPAPEATDDMGEIADMATGSTTTVSPLPAPFTQLDKSFVCSDQISSTTNSVRIDGLNNGTTYQFVVLAIDSYGNATWPVTNSVVTGTPQPVEDLYRRYRDAGGTASGFCFIATAAYGSYENRWVRVLRDFRDAVLLPTHAGTRFVDWYYAHSPGPASYIAAHSFARAVTRVALWPVIGFAAVWLYVPAWLKLLWLLAIGGLLALKRLRPA
jgi:hypothetical protein